ncbi:MAG: hypothetical protein J6O51_00865 [Bacteroidales bacterium]|nr:hypothetical protein [Bacteroidales bacterium]
MKLLKKIFQRKVKPATVNLDFPTKWERMTPHQFRDVCRILSVPNIDRERALMLCLFALTGIQPLDPAGYDAKVLKNGRLQPFLIDGKEHLIAASDVSAACHELSFIYDSIGLPPCPLDNVDPNLHGVSFRQFFIADSYILRYLSDKNGSYLKEAAKTLSGGRKRRLLEWERTAMVIWWNGVKDLLKQKYPLVFQEGGGISGKTQSDILEELLSCMNGNHPQENDRILRTEAHSVLFSLNRIYEDANHKVSR